MKKNKLGRDEIYFSIVKSKVQVERGVKKKKKKSKLLTKKKVNR